MGVSKNEPITGMIHEDHMIYHISYDLRNQVP